MKAILKNILYLAVACIMLSCPAMAQQKDTTALKTSLKAHPQQDTIRVNLLNKLGFLLYRNKADAAFGHYTEAYKIASKLQYKQGEAMALTGMGFYHRFRGEYPLALKYTLQAEKLYKSLNDVENQLVCAYNLGSIYGQTDLPVEAVSTDLRALSLAQKVKSQKWIVLFDTHLSIGYVYLNDTEKGLRYLDDALAIALKTNDVDGIKHCYVSYSNLYVKRGDWLKALEYAQKASDFSLKVNDQRSYLQGLVNIAEIRMNMGKTDSVLFLCNKALKLINTVQDFGDIAYVQDIMATAYLKLGKPDSAVKYALLSLKVNQVRGEKGRSRNSSKTLAAAYAQLGKWKDAYRYESLFGRYRDSLNERESLRKLDAAQYTNDLDKKQSQIKLLTINTQLAVKQQQQQKILLIVVIAGLIAVAVFSVVLLRSNRQKQLANKRLLQQQEELKATQAQLIQSEKMASLGELTAGIAHEIQNPLNFVNNFSEVSIELLDELKEEAEAGHTEDVVAIANDLTQNLQKINQHGKRADGIVKGMLEHSRASTGEKQPTNINQLVDEFLKLAYHGLRAKDKDFNAELVTHFGETLPKANIVQQDIGRVLLNLFNNAFYAVHEKAKTAAPDYKPTVTVSTFTPPSGGWGVSVGDNGNGIPDAIKDKIMQPFFTTKPTGQGTGLGLSISYDIVVKGHGGKIDVQSREGEGSEFVIQIP